MAHILLIKECIFSLDLNNVVHIIVIVTVSFCQWWGFYEAEIRTKLEIGKTLYNGLRTRMFGKLSWHLKMLLLNVSEQLFKFCLYTLA